MGIPPIQMDPRALMQVAAQLRGGFQGPPPANANVAAGMAQNDPTAALKELFAAFAKLPQEVQQTITKALQAGSQQMLGGPGVRGYGANNLQQVPYMQQQMQRIAPPQ